MPMQSETIAALNQPMVCKIDLLSFPAVITFDLMRTPHYWRPNTTSISQQCIHYMISMHTHI